MAKTPTKQLRVSLDMPAGHLDCPVCESPKVDQIGMVVQVDGKTFWHNRDGTISDAQDARADRVFPSWLRLLPDRHNTALLFQCDTDQHQFALVFSEGPNKTDVIVTTHDPRWKQLASQP